MTTNLTVLVASSTGMLGSKIVSALLDKGNIDVRAMVRSIDDSSGENRKKIDAMKGKGLVKPGMGFGSFKTALAFVEGVRLG